MTNREEQGDARGRAAARLRAADRLIAAFGLVALGSAALLVALPPPAPSTPVPALGAALPAPAPRCLHVVSYHEGYAWSDELRAGLEPALGDVCALETLYMDTKRDRRPEHARAVGAAIARRIDEDPPDVVIVSDDNAVRHLVVPHLVGGPVPIVFSGVNWTVEEYGLPAPGVTGMVEVAPIGRLLDEALAMAPRARVATYLGADTPTERKNYERYVAAARERGLEVRGAFAADAHAWETGFEAAQSTDLVLIGSSGGVEGWSDERAAAFARETALRPSYTVHGWMMPVAMLGMTKIAEEQGRWAASCARAILAGRAPESIPLVTNRAADVWINEQLVAVAGVSLPSDLARAARRTASVEGV